MSCRLSGTSSSTALAAALSTCMKMYDLFAAPARTSRARVKARGGARGEGMGAEPRATMPQRRWRVFLARTHGGAPQHCGAFGVSVVVDVVRVQQHSKLVDLDVLPLVHPHHRRVHQEGPHVAHCLCAPGKTAVSGALKAKRPGGITARDGGLLRGGRGCPLRGSYARDRSHQRVPSEQGRVLAVVGAVCAPSFFAPELASLPPSFIIASISSCRSSFGSRNRLAMR